MNIWKKAGYTDLRNGRWKVGYINGNRMAKYKMKEITFNSSGSAVYAYHKGISASSKASKTYRTKLTPSSLQKLKRAFKL